MSTLTVITHHR